MNTNAKDKIADALIRLSKKQSIDSILVKDLIQEAGINRSSYYYHFGAIEDVVDYIIDNFTSELGRLLTLTFSSGYDAMLNYYDYIYENQEKYLSLHNSAYRSRLVGKMTERAVEAFSQLDIFFDDSNGGYYTLKGRDERLYIEVIAAREVALISWWADTYFERSPAEIYSCDIGIELSKWSFTKFKKEHFNNNNRYPVLDLHKVVELSDYQFPEKKD